MGSRIPDVQSVGSHFTLQSLLVHQLIINLRLMNCFLCVLVLDAWRERVIWSVFHSQADFIEIWYSVYIERCEDFIFVHISSM
jgi:hypothetical protein